MRDFKRNHTLLINTVEMLISSFNAQIRKYILKSLIVIIDELLLMKAGHVNFIEPLIHVIPQSIK